MQSSKTLKNETKAEWNSSSVYVYTYIRVGRNGAEQRVSEIPETRAVCDPTGKEVLYRAFYVETERWMSQRFENGAACASNYLRRKEAPRVFQLRVHGSPHTRAVRAPQMLGNRVSRVPSVWKRSSTYFDYPRNKFPRSQMPRMYSTPAQLYYWLLSNQEISSFFIRFYLSTYLPLSAIPRDIFRAIRIYVYLRFFFSNFLSADTRIFRYGNVTIGQDSRCSEMS